MSDISVVYYVFRHEFNLRGFFFLNIRFEYLVLFKALYQHSLMYKYLNVAGNRTSAAINGYYRLPSFLL